MARRSVMLAGLPLLLLLGASGCHTYKYFDINVRFDDAPASGQTAGFDSALAFRVNICRVNVSGADTDSFILPGCPHRAPSTDPLNVGAFEFSTFADSGNLTFTLDAFEGNMETAACKLGEGSTTIKVTSMMTINGDLKIQKVGDGCPNVQPPMGTDSGLGGGGG
jgi:hypothetical protein